MNGTLDAKLLRLAGAAGVLGVLSATLGGAIIAPVWAFPGTASSGAQIATYVAAHRTALVVGMILNAAGVTLWIVFAAGVWSRVRRTAVGDNVLATCFAFGMTATATLLLAGFTAFFVLISQRLPTVAARPLYDMTFGLLAISGAPTAVALGAFGAITVRSNALPRQTGVIAMIAAAAHAALLGSFIPDSGFYSLEGQIITAIPATLFAWIAITGIWLIRTADDPSADDAADIWPTEQLA